MNLAITIARWIIAKQPQHAAIILQQHRIRKERALIKRVARQLREECNMPPLKVLG